MKNCSNFFNQSLYYLLLLTVLAYGKAVCAETSKQGSDLKVFTSIVSKKDSVIVRFERTKLVGMASVFLEGKWLIIFDQSIDLELPSKEPIFKSIFESFNVIEKKPGYTLATVQFTKGIIPCIQKIGNDWCFELFSGSLEKREKNKDNTSISIKKGNKWPEITIHHADPGKGISIQYGEYNMFVIPTSKVDGGLQVFYKTPFYELINTTQGVACLSLSPYTFFERMGNAYLVKIAKDILLKRDVTIEEHLTPSYTLTPSTEKSFLEVRKLEDKIIAHHNVDDHLDLALHYLAQANGEKVLSILSAVISYAPAMKFNPVIQRLMCLANLFKREYKECLKIAEMLHPSFELEVWKQIGSTQIYQVDFLSSLENFVGGMLKHYPPTASQRLMPDLLEIINNLEAESLKKLLTTIDLQPLNHHLQLVQEFYAAESMRKNGERVTSSILYKKIAGVDKAKYPLIAMYQLRAEFEIILNQVDFKELTIEQAVDKLTNIHLRWKGDLLEFRILQKIIDFYEQLKNFEKTLKYMNILKNVSLSPFRKILIEHKMRKILKAYFLERTKEQGNAVEILSIYENYQKIMGDEDSLEIINLIVQSFLELDLLDQASDFLVRSYAKMPDNIHKHKLQIESARIYILNQKYQSALTVLDSISEQASPDIQQKKIILKATALRHSGKLSQALSLLGRSSDPVVLRKMADILIEEKRWKEASKCLGILVGLIDETVKLEEKKQAILDYAVILKSQGNATELEVLRKSYGTLMKSDSLFTMLTAKKDESPKNREELESTLKGMKQFGDLIKKIDSFTGAS